MIFAPSLCRHCIYTRASVHNSVRYKDELGGARAWKCVGYLSMLVLLHSLDAEVTLVEVLTS